MDNKPAYGVEKVYIQVERKYNLKNYGGPDYESLTVVCGATLHVDGDAPREAVDAMMRDGWKMLVNNVKAQAQPFTKLGEPLDRAWLGLPTDAPIQDIPNDEFNQELT